MRTIRQWIQGFVIATVLVSGQVMAQQTTTWSAPANAQPISSFNTNTTPSSYSQQSKGVKFGIVNTKKCLEESKLGKLEQVNFEKKKKQMETVLQDKERLLEEIESKLEDEDYMDSISEEAANELKRKKRQIKNEGMQLQNQYLRGLQEENLKIVKKLTEAISKASAAIAQDNSTGQNFDAIFTDEACTFYAPSLDVSDLIIKKMNENFDAEQKNRNS